MGRDWSSSRSDALLVVLGLLLTFFLIGLLFIGLELVRVCDPVLIVFVQRSHSMKGVR